MFDDIGGKIKALAKVTCGLGIAASIIGAIALWMQNSDYNPTAFSGVLVLGMGSLASWIGSFFTYGFGELIENSETLHADNLRIQELLKTQQGESTDSAPVVHPVRISKPQSSESLLSNDEWECAACGMRNSKRTNSCINCGRRRMSL